MKKADGEAAPRRIVNRAELAVFFEVSVQTIDAWVRRGCPFRVRGSHGVPWEFDILEVTRWKYGGGPAKQDDEEDADDPEQMSPKDRLDWYRGNRERDAHAKDQDLLIPFELSEMVIGAAFSAVRAGLLSQHNTIAQEFPEIPADAIRRILTANRELLKSLSETQLPKSVAGALDALAVEPDTRNSLQGEKFCRAPPTE